MSILISICARFDFRRCPNTGLLAVEDEVVDGRVGIAVAPLDARRGPT